MTEFKYIKVKTNEYSKKQYVNEDTDLIHTEIAYQLKRIADALENGVCIKK